MAVVCLSVPCLTLSREWKGTLKIGMKKAHDTADHGPILKSEAVIYPDPRGGYNPPVFMRHPQPSEVQRGLSGGGVFTGGAYVIVMEG